MDEKQKGPEDDIHSRRVEVFGGETLGLAGIYGPPKVDRFDSTAAKQAALRVIKGIEPPKLPADYKRADRPSVADAARDAEERKAS